jgi:hypothetical protein
MSDEEELKPMMNQEGDEPRVYDYDQAIETTVDYNRPFFGKIAQTIIVFVALMVLNSANFIIMGLPFMKSEP